MSGLLVMHFLPIYHHLYQFIITSLIHVGKPFPIGISSNVANPHFLDAAFEKAIPQP